MMICRITWPPRYGPFHNYAEVAFQEDEKEAVVALDGFLQRLNGQRLPHNYEIELRGNSNPHLQPPAFVLTCRLYEEEFRKLDAGLTP